MALGKHGWVQWLRVRKSCRLHRPLVEATLARTDVWPRSLQMAQRSCPRLLPFKVQADLLEARGHARFPARVQRSCRLRHPLTVQATPAGADS